MRKKKEGGKRRKEGEMKESILFHFDKFLGSFVLRWRKKERTEREMTEELKLPKNVRQIGRAMPEKKLYIEDYVITFARKQTKKKAEPQLAVLLGKESQKQGEPLFISGAVLVEDFAIETSLLLSNENWSQVYEEIKAHFSELEIVGCLLIQMASWEAPSERIQRLYRENFGEGHKVLFLYDGEEKEEHFYLLENGLLQKQEGFYIYYEKNEAMQEYMIGKSDGASEEPLFEDKAMKRVRETIAAKPRKKEHTPEHRLLQLMYGASMVLAAAVLVIGITMLDSHDKMQSMETTLNVISDKVSENTPQPVVVETLPGNTHVSSNEEMKKAEVEKEEAKESEAETKEVVAKKNYYTVKEGDTLAFISLKEYNTLDMVKEIQELNEIDDRDKIYIGQKLLLP